MSAKRYSEVDIEPMKLNLKEILPPGESENDAEIFHELIRRVLPNFNKVEFILAEILELQRNESKATTHVYSCFDQATNAELIDNYFQIINAIEKNSNISITPNPTNGEVNIHWKNIHSRISSLTLISLDGKILNTHQIHLTEGNWDLSSMQLKKGLYIIMVTQDNKVNALRLVVM